MQHYYLLNGTVKKGGEMPKLENEMKDQKSFIEYWLSSLQPCEISESDLEDIEIWLNNNGYDGNFKDPIDITDIVEEIIIHEDCLVRNESILKFKQPKQVESDLCPYCESSDLDLDEKFCNNCTEYFEHPKQVESECEAVDDQHGAFAQMYKKAQNMDIFDFIAMFSEKYKIFKNR